MPPKAGSSPGDRRDDLVEVYERERAAVARQLHDGPVQTLTAASLRLQSAAHFDELTPELAGEVVAGMADAAAQLRQLMTSLAAWSLGGGELGETLERHVLQVCGQHGVEAAIDVEALGQLAPRHAATVFRVVQEAVANVLRHAGVQQVEVRVAKVAAQVVVEVRDAGCGFDPDVADEHDGLELMRRRLEAVGGQLTLLAAPGAGTSVHAAVPLGRPARGEE